MIAVIKGDIIASREFSDPQKWLSSLKELLNRWGKAPRDWELAWGDFFQLEIPHPEEALYKAFVLKALLKRISPAKPHKRISAIGVRMSIGLGEKDFSGARISESNGSAFVYAGEKFDTLKKEKTNLAIKSPWPDFDEEINLYLRLCAIFMDNWSVSSAELAEIVLQHPKATQEEIGKLLGIKQNSVSGRWRRAQIDEIVAIDDLFRKKLKYQRAR